MALDISDFYPVHADAIDPDEPLNVEVAQGILSMAGHIQRTRLRKFTSVWPSTDVISTPYDENKRPLRLATLPGEWRCLTFLWKPTPSAKGLRVTPFGCVENVAMDLSLGIEQFSPPDGGRTSYAVTAGAPTPESLTSLEADYPAGLGVNAPAIVTIWFRSALGSTDGDSGEVFEARTQYGDCTRLMEQGSLPAAWVNPSQHIAPYKCVVWSDKGSELDTPVDDQPRLVLCTTDLTVNDQFWVYPTIDWISVTDGPDWDSYDMSLLTLHSLKIEEIAEDLEAAAGALSAGSAPLGSMVSSTAQTVNEARALNTKVHCIFPRFLSQGANYEDNNGANASLSSIVWDYTFKTVSDVLVYRNDESEFDVWFLWTPLAKSASRASQTVDATFRVVWAAFDGTIIDTGDEWTVETVTAAPLEISWFYLLAGTNGPNPLEGRMTGEEFNYAVLTHVPSSAWPTYGSTNPGRLQLQAKCHEGREGLAVHSVLVTGRAT